MPTKLLNLIPANRRDKLFQEIRFLINEVDAQDRSLEHCGEGMAVVGADYVAGGVVGGGFVGGGAFVRDPGVRHAGGLL